MERKKFCPVCGELVAVYQGDESKYGDKAVWNYYRFIRLKYDCQECRDMMKGQSNHNANKRYRERCKNERTALIDIVGAYRERVSLLERENRASRERLRQLEAVVCRS